MKWTKILAAALVLQTGLFNYSCYARALQTQRAIMSEAAPKIYLVGDDLSTWRDNTGTWQVAGEARVHPENDRLLTTKPGNGTIVNGPKGKTVSLFSKAEFGDIVTHIEFMIPRKSNSGVYFMGRYELQIYDSWGIEHSEYPGIECGGIYERWDKNRTPKGFEGHSPRVNASLPPGQWQSYDVIFRAPRFDQNGKKIANASLVKVIHNGKLVHENVELTGPTRAGAYNNEQPTGPLMLQGHHGPVAYRNIWIAPAGPNPFFAMDTGTKDANHRTPKQQADILTELGYAGIGYTGVKAIPEMLEELDTNGLGMFTIYLGVNIDPDKQRYNPQLKEAIKQLKGRGTMLWLTVGSSKHKPSSPDGDPYAVEVIREIADMAHESGLRVALYPHTNAWLERVEDAVRLTKKVNRRNVGATFNLCHWLRVDEGKNMKPLMELAMPYLFVVTINGADSSGTGWKELIQTLDRGSFDVGGFLKTLTDLGYTGPIGLQGYGIKGDVHENLKRSMNAWQKLSKRLATNEK